MEHMSEFEFGIEDAARRGLLASDIVKEDRDEHGRWTSGGGSGDSQSKTDGAARASNVAVGMTSGLRGPNVPNTKDEVKSQSGETQKGHEEAARAHAEAARIAGGEGRIASSMLHVSASMAHRDAADALASGDLNKANDYGQQAAALANAASQLHGITGS